MHWDSKYDDLQSAINPKWLLVKNYFQVPYKLQNVGLFLNLVQNMYFFLIKKVNFIISLKTYLYPLNIEP